MPFLLLTPREDIQDTFKLADAATALGWRVERASSYQPTRADYPQDDIVLYGETFFTTLVGQKLALIILEPPFDLLYVLPVFGIAAHNEDVKLLLIIPLCS